MEDKLQEFGLFWASIFFFRSRGIERPSPGPIGANYGLFWAIKSFVIFQIPAILILVFLSFGESWAGELGWGSWAGEPGWRGGNFIFNVFITLIVSELYTGAV